MLRQDVSGQLFEDLRSPRWHSWSRAPPRLISPRRAAPQCAGTSTKSLIDENFRCREVYGSSVSGPRYEPANFRAACFSRVRLCTPTAVQLRERISENVIVTQTRVSIPDKYQ
jgi:hypothetical protein